MKPIFIALILFGIQSIFGQTDDYNLEFEKPTKNKAIQNWQKKNDGVDISLDSITKFQGKYSLKMSSNFKGDGIPGIENIINKTFEGKEIELNGYLKTENIQSAYIYLIAGDENNQFSFAMSPTISGTTDWQKLNVKIPYNSESTKITIASNIVGSGQVWLDALSLKIDGVDIYSLNPININEDFDSGFITGVLVQIEIDRLMLLGKLWGFLKYYHPKVATGDYDWDKQLFQMLPLIKEDDFDSKLEKWVASLGNFQIQKTIETHQNIKFSPDFKWFNNKFITPNLKNQLTIITKAKRLETNYYVNIPQEIPKPIFENEKIYSTIKYNDDGVKLLALFRYWNYIEYFYPYKYLITSNWDSVLEEFIPKIHKTKNETDYTLCLAELIAKTEDTHHFIMFNESLDHYFGEFKAPVSTKFIDDKLVVITSYSQENNIKEGDIIQKIDSLSTKTLKEKYLKYSVASNLTTTLREVAKKIIRTNKKRIELTISREGIIFQTTVSTIPFHEKILRPRPNEQIKELSSEIGYLDTEYLRLKDYDSIFHKWQNKKTIIFDIRNYPKENFIRLLPYFFEKPISFFSSTCTNLQNPGFFSFEPIKIFETKNGYQFNGKIIVLVNNESQSKSEFNILALKSYSKSIIIGNQTAGTDGDTTPIILPGNIQTDLTGIGIYKLDKSETQKVGIKPDIVITPTLEDIKNKKDVILEMAIREASK